MILIRIFCSHVYIYESLFLGKWLQYEHFPFIVSLYGQLLNSSSTKTWKNNFFRRQGKIVWSSSRMRRSLMKFKVLKDILEISAHLHQLRMASLWWVFLTNDGDGVFLSVHLMSWIIVVIIFLGTCIAWQVDLSVGTHWRDHHAGRRGG